LELLRALPDIRRDTLGFLLGLSRCYGPVVRFPMGRETTAFFLNDPAAIRHVLRDQHRRYSKHTLQFTTLSLVTGQGLLTSDGDFWLRQRRLMQPAFHRQALAGFARAMVTAAERLAARWACVPAGQPLDVDADMMATTLEIVGETLFSADLSPQANEMVAATLEALDFIIYRSQNPFDLPLAVPTTRHRAFKYAVARLDQAAYDLIDERQRGPAQPDLLQMLLDARDEHDQPMARTQLRDEIITLIIAGHETVASALTWTWHLLGQHPGAFDRVRAESLALGPGPLDADALPRLPYTRAVFDEALRLFPPAWVITREAREADCIAGHVVAARSLIIISPYTLHRQPELWPDAEAFQPERFLARTSASDERFTYLPFGGGPRLCIGNHYALLEGALMLATLARGRRLTLAPGAPPQPTALVTIRPSHGLPMVFTDA
jgi:cytochrome P450